MLTPLQESRKRELQLELLELLRQQNQSLSWRMITGAYGITKKINQLRKELLELDPEACIYDKHVEEYQ